MKTEYVTAGYVCDTTARHFESGTYPEHNAAPKGEDMKRPRIADAREITRGTGARGAVILTFDRNGYAIASYGSTKSECSQLAAFVDALSHELDIGALTPWSETDDLAPVGTVDPQGKEQRP